MPGPANTSSNALWLRFRSDSSGSARGFKLRYSELSNGCGGSVILTQVIE